jgi:ABC-type transport system involved in multi-copper enzyme maturation permease subunit
VVVHRLNRVAAVAGNTFRESVRERVLYNLVFFAIVMTVSGLVLGELSIRQDEKIIKDLGLAAIDFFGTLIAIFVAVGLVSKEIERRSLYPLLAKPLGRAEFFLGKFLGLAFTLLVNTTVMSIGLMTTLWMTGAGLDPTLLKAILPIYLGLLLIVALALLFSTFTSAPLAAIGTVCIVVAGRYSDLLRHMKNIAPGGPGWLLEVLYFALPNFRNFDLKNRVVYGDPLPWTAVGEVGLYAAIYTSVLVVAGVLIFRSRDFR